MIKNYFFYPALLLTVFAVLIGKSLFAVSLPADIPVKSEQPRGKYLYQVMFFDIYEATYWCDSEDFSYENTFAVIMDMKYDLESTELSERLVKAMKKMHEFDDATASEYQKLLSESIPDLEDGDIMTLVNYYEKPLVIYLNGKIIQTKGDALLKRRLFDLWFSPKAKPETRNSMLGKN